MTAPKVQTWTLPAHPGPEVTKVRDGNGYTWTRMNPPEFWVWNGSTRHWAVLLMAGPITDATHGGQS